MLQRLLAGYDGWETVQHPVNLVDPHYLSFIQNVMPKVRTEGLGLLAMKSNAMGGIGKNQIATYTIVFSGLSCFANATLVDRRRKAIVCPTLP